MRMVIEVPDDLHAKLKAKAKAEDRPVAKIVRELINEYLDGKRRGSPASVG
jgi:predicted DNA-binding protein